MNDTQKGSVKLTDRKTLAVDGVINVGGFDENFVIISTSLGELNVEGEGLKIENLSNERGEIFIRGKINAVYYADKIQKRRKKRE